MKEIRVYDDGKFRRIMKGRIVKERSKRILIEYDNEWDDLGLVRHWFRRVRKYRGGVYCSVETNTWFYRFRESEEFIKDLYDNSDWYGDDFLKEYFPLCT